MKATHELLGGALERVRHRWHQHRTDQELQLPGPLPARPFTIAISRESGAGAPAVAHEIGDLTGWAVYDRELLDKIANETGLRTELLESVDEKCTPWLTTALEAFAGEKTINSNTYALQLAHTILALSTRGEAVIVGRGASALLPAETTLRVRLIAPLAYRIAGIEKDRGLSAREAARYVEQTDRDRNAFVRTYFQKDASDQHLYDLILNSSRFTARQSAELIVAAMQKRKDELAATTGQQT